MTANNTENKNQNKKRRTVAEPKVSVALKRLWKAEGQGMSLKVFARTRKGDALVKRWNENRLGKHDAKRSGANETMARTCANATKLSRKKVKK